MRGRLDSEFRLGAASGCGMERDEFDGPIQDQAACLGVASGGDVHPDVLGVVEQRPEVRGRTSAVAASQSPQLVWEISIKKALGKLDSPDDIEAAMGANRFLPLPITIPHALAVQALPDVHRDPLVTRSERPLSNAKNGVGWSRTNGLGRCQDKLLV